MPGNGDLNASAFIYIWRTLCPGHWVPRRVCCVTNSPAQCHNRSAFGTGFLLGSRVSPIEDQSALLRKGRLGGGGSPRPHMRLISEVIAFPFSLLICNGGFHSTGDFTGSAFAFRSTSWWPVFIATGSYWSLGSETLQSVGQAFPRRRHAQSTVGVLKCTPSFSHFCNFSPTLRLQYAMSTFRVDPVFTVGNLISSGRWTDKSADGLPMVPYQRLLQFM